MKDAAPTDTTNLMDPPAIIHPAFTHMFVNADLTLLSKDGYLFPVASETLARVSGWFNTMFTIPQKPSTRHSTEPIAMSESSDVLAGLLSIVGGVSLPCLDDISFVDTLLFTAEKYDMPLPIAVLRLALPSFLGTHPIRVYGMACRMSWETEAQKAASRTLASNIFSPESLLELRHVETPYLIKLLSLHERRRTHISQKLDNADTFSANDDTPCRSCEEPLHCASWVAFKLTWSREPWRFVGLGDPTSWPRDIPELDALLETTCKCGTNAYSEEATMRNLQSLACELPVTVEWD